MPVENADAAAGLVAVAAEMQVGALGPMTAMRLYLALSSGKKIVLVFQQDERFARGF